MCVLARDEWRKNWFKYAGLCSLFRRVIFDNGRVVTDNENLNHEINTFFWCYRYGNTFGGFPVVKLIPAFRRPPGRRNAERGYWWPCYQKSVREKFLNELVNIYAKLIDEDLK